MNIYRDIATRTDGNIYIGVVGPVRCGKSTFIKRFMETAVIPNIENEYDRKRSTDELPQSAGGRTVMTTEPKFIPDEAIEVSFGDSAKISVKMIDCVGYLVPGALGNEEDGIIRMVSTPWSDEPMPFEKAAEAGTKKVINEHSTIGMLVTTDGSFGDLSRESFVEAEERVARELREIGKPFAIILNSSEPESEEAVTLAMELEKKYAAPTALVNCLELDRGDIEHILEMLLYEFPAKELVFSLPDWAAGLERDHWLYRSIEQTIASLCTGIKRIADVHESLMRELPERVMESLAEHMGVDMTVSARVDEADLGRGALIITISLDNKLYYRIIGELTGINIESEGELLSALKSLAAIKHEYDKFSSAIDEVNETGYGIVMPDIEDLTLEEPEIVKQAGGYGVRLRASAPSIHLIRAGIETEINPIVGTEQQSEEMVRYLLREFEQEPQSIWESNLFGKSLHELVNEGLHGKLAHMPEEARQKLSETLAKIINEGSGGLICIIL